MEVRQLKIGDFRREVLSTQLGRKFITVSVHLMCLQHVHCDTACRTGFLATADPCYTQAYLQLSIKHLALLQLLTCCRLACYCSCHDIIIPNFQTESRFFFQKPNRFGTNSAFFLGGNRTKPNNKSIINSANPYQGYIAISSLILTP